MLYIDYYWWENMGTYIEANKIEKWLNDLEKSLHKELVENDELVNK